MPLQTNLNSINYGFVTFLYTFVYALIKQQSK